MVKSELDSEISAAREQALQRMESLIGRASEIDFTAPQNRKHYTGNYYSKLFSLLDVAAIT